MKSGFDVNQFLEQYKYNRRGLLLRPVILCGDGLEISIQASSLHYCTPREDVGPYSTVEVGFPSKRIAELMPYAEDPDDPTNTVYGNVPIEIVEHVVNQHGGFVRALTRGR